MAGGHAIHGLLFTEAKTIVQSFSEKAADERQHQLVARGHAGEANPSCVGDVRASVPEKCGAASTRIFAVAAAGGSCA
jgi:adenylosuccinate lyase